jgi:hypothetical protein
MSPWLALAGLGAFHGINPAMGWLFAVALGLHRGSRTVVLTSLIPIALGHALAVALIVLAVVLLGRLLDPRAISLVSGLVLIGWAAYHHLYGSRHRVRYAHWRHSRLSPDVARTVAWPPDPPPADHGSTPPALRRSLIAWPPSSARPPCSRPEPCWVYDWLRPWPPPPRLDQPRPLLTAALTAPVLIPLPPRRVSMDQSRTGVRPAFRNVNCNDAPEPVGWTERRRRGGVGDKAGTRGG